MRGRLAVVMLLVTVFSSQALAVDIDPGIDPEYIQPGASVFNAPSTAERP